MPIDATTPVDEGHLVQRLYEKALASARRHGHEQVLLRRDLLKEKVESVYTSLRDEYARAVSMPEAQSAAFYFVDAVLTRYDRSKEAPYKPQPYPFSHERQHTPLDALQWDTPEQLRYNAISLPQELRSGASNIQTRRYNLTQQFTGMTELYQPPFVSFDEVAAHALGRPGYKLDLDGGLIVETINRHLELQAPYPEGELSHAWVASDRVHSSMMDYLRRRETEGAACPPLESFFERDLSWFASYYADHPPLPSPVRQLALGAEIAGQSSAARAAEVGAARG